MEIKQILQRYNDFISSNIDDIDVFIGQSFSADSTHINIYPTIYSFTYDQEYCNIVVETVLPKQDLSAGMEFADNISKIIELDNLDDIRLSSYDTEFFWNEDIAGVIIIFNIMLQIKRCR